MESLNLLRRVYKLKYRRKGCWGIILLVICYIEGTFFDICINAIKSLSSSNQVENSAGANIAAYAQLLSRVMNCVVIVQWILCAVILLGGIYLYYKSTRIQRFLTFLLECKNIHVIAYWMIWGILFFSFGQFDSFYKSYGVEQLDLSQWNALLIICLTLIGTWIIQTGKIKVKNIFETKVNFCFFCIIWLYIDFAVFGEALFLSDTSVAWKIDVQRISLLGLAACWLLPFILGFIYFLEGFSKKKRELHRNCLAEILSLILIMILGYTLYLIVTYPGIITMDGIVAWEQIINYAPLTREFPAFLKLIWKICYSVYPNVFGVTILQAVLWISVVIRWLTYFVSKGMSIKCARWIAFATSFTTPFTLFVLMQESNFYYTVALLWTTYFMVKISEADENRIMHWYSWVGIIISLVGIFVSRNEGKVTFAVITVVLLLYSIFQKNWKLCASGFISIALIVVIQGPLFSWLKIPELNAKSEYSTNLLINDVTLATVYFNGKISKESIDILEKYAAIDDIANMYNDHNYDCGADGNIASFIGNDNEVYPVAIDCIVHNIPIAFRERLNKTETVWNVVAVPDVKQAHLSIGIVENDLGLKSNSGIISKIFTQLLYYPTFLICIFDVLIYRSGLAICMLMVLCYFWIINGKRKFVIKALPCFAHFSILLLSLLWACSRHVFCIVIMVWALLINQIYSGEQHESIGNNTGI